MRQVFRTILPATLAGLLSWSCLELTPDREHASPVLPEEEFLNTAAAFSAASVDSSGVTLTWSDRSIREDRNILEWSIDNGAFHIVDTLPANTQSFRFAYSFDRASTYAFRLVTERGSARSAPSNSVAVEFEDAYYVASVQYQNPQATGRIRRRTVTSTSVIAEEVVTGSPPYHDLALWNNQVVVVGRFTQIGGVRALHVAQWAGNTWGPIGDGIDHVAPSRISVVDTTMYVGTYYDFQNPSRMFVWNGTRFASYQPFSQSILGNVTQMAVENASVYFAFSSGILNSPPAFPPVAVVGMSGTSFLSIPQPDIVDLGNYQRNGVAVLDGQLYLALLRYNSFDDPAPDTSLIRFDGVAWHVEDASGTRRIMLALGAWNGSVYAGFTDLDSVNTVKNVLARWTGTSWEEIRRVYVSGIMADGDGLIVTASPDVGDYGIIARWDGSTWTEIFALPTDEYPLSVVHRRAWVWRPAS